LCTKLALFTRLHRNARSTKHNICFLGSLQGSAQMALSSKPWPFLRYSYTSSGAFKNSQINNQRSINLQSTNHDSFQLPLNRTVQQPLKLLVEITSLNLKFDSSKDAACSNPIDRPVHIILCPQFKLLFLIVNFVRGGTAFHTSGLYGFQKIPCNIILFYKPAVAQLFKIFPFFFLTFWRRNYFFNFSTPVYKM